MSAATSDSAEGRTAASPAGSVTAPSAASERPRFLRTFESLGDANYRWFFGAMVAGFTGLSMQTFVAGWLTYELTGSFAALGFMSLANGLSNIVFSNIGGGMADRVARKQSLVQTGQVMSAVTAFVMVVIIAAGWLHFWHVVAAAMLLSGAHILTMPARQSLTPDVAGMHRLQNAAALYTFGQNTATLLMPATAGFILGAAGGDAPAAKYVYAIICGVQFGAALLLGRVRVPPREVSGARRAILGELIAGLRYVRHHPQIRLILGFHIFAAMFVATYMSLLPGFAKEVLGVGASRLGLLQAMLGLGAISGALIVGSLPPRRRGTVLLVAVVWLGAALAVMSLITSYTLALPAAVLIGMGQTGYLTMCPVLLQTYVDPEFRGRVLSIYLMQFGLWSIGIFGIGLLANAAGPQTAMRVSAVLLAGGALTMLAFVRSFREID